MVASIWVFQLERDHIGGIILPRQESGKQDCGAELEDDALTFARKTWIVGELVLEMGKLAPNKGHKRLLLVRACETPPDRHVSVWALIACIPLDFVSWTTAFYQGDDLPIHKGFSG